MALVYESIGLLIRQLDKPFMRVTGLALMPKLVYFN